MASRPALGRKRGVAGLSRSRGGGEPCAAMGNLAVDVQGLELMAHHACRGSGFTHQQSEANAPTEGANKSTSDAQGARLDDVGP